MQTEMREYLGRSWGWIVLRGAAAVLFGVLALARPGITLAALVFMWGAYAMADGVLALVAAWQIRGQGQPLWSLFVVGALGIVARGDLHRIAGIAQVDEIHSLDDPACGYI